MLMSLNFIFNYQVLGVRGFFIIIISMYLLGIKKKRKKKKRFTFSFVRVRLQQKKKTFYETIYDEAGQRVSGTTNTSWQRVPS